MNEPGESWATVVATVGMVEASLNQWLSQHHGVGLTDFRALVNLVEAPDRELRITELATRVGLTQSSATRLVGRLEVKGLVVRDTCPDDGRGVFAVVTEAGLALVQELLGSYAERLAEVLASPHVASGRGAASRAFRVIAELTP